MEKTLKKDIMCILPTYIKGKGNCTLLVTKTDEVILDKSVKTVMNRLCKYYCIDFEESNKYNRSELYIRKNPPLSLTINRTYISVKVRKPIGRHDGAHGYVKLEGIKKVNNEEKGVTMELVNGFKINILSNYKTVMKNIRNGKYIKAFFIDRRYHSFLYKLDAYMVKEEDEALDDQLLDIIKKLKKIILDEAKYKD